MTDADPKGLIREAYRIDGITEGECRSIFLDWALGRDADDLSDEIRGLLLAHGDTAPAHPMTKVLNEGLAAPPRAKRRGGWRARRT